VSKMLCLHIPSLIPQHFSSIDVASPVQAAAVAGAGLLYQRSSHRMMTEFLLNEIGKRPASDVNAFDREAYNLSCGIALGMVNLCQGDPLNGDSDVGGNGLADLRIEERLYRYVVGGIDDVEMRRRRDENDRLSLPSSSAANNNEKCSCVYEGESINTDVTAPGATLALGLIYMKSGNRTIASAIALPDTHFLLEYVRPDFLMLRVIARALILWNEVQPSKAWIDAQLPPVVRKAYSQMRAAAKKATGFSGMGDSSGPGIDQENVDMPGAERTSNHTSSQHDQDYDRQAVRQIYAHVIAGACFAIGLRFAGTGDKEAAAAIYERVMELRDANDPVSGVLRPAGPVLEMCLGCAAMSLSLVLAGTGDLEAFKLLKVLRWRCDEDVNYGTHMQYGAAIGLLFLGGGSCTLGRDPEDIAVLIMSFYPRYPSTTSDNQYHLQALRNVYALAVKPRELRAVDVDTGESIFVPVEVRILRGAVVCVA
jgi:anaphase-promoting complex subunit 1